MVSTGIAAGSLGRLRLSAEDSLDLAPTPSAPIPCPRIGPFWRGHLFLFDKPAPEPLSPQQSRKMLIVFLLLEGILRPLFKGAHSWLAIANRPCWSLLQLSFLAALACILLVKFAEVPLLQVGLYPWRKWSRTEKLYFPQMLTITIAVFIAAQWPELKALIHRHDVGHIALFVFVPQMVWGFYQELLYRGILQTELVRRWGPVVGVLTSNLFFTFGPLHAYHFRIARVHPSHLWIFAGIFSIGLFFSILFQRSRNLGMIAILHGLGDWFIDGLDLVAHMKP
jgi:membrane protease YdiL (CAAX protease family)